MDIRDKSEIRKYVQGTAYMSCQRVISGRRVGREAGQERVAYDVMRPKALRKRDEVAGVEAEDRRESEAEDGRESEV